MRHFPKSRRAASLTLAAVLVYVAAAYVAAPEFWFYRDENRIVVPGSMVTTTTDGIPGDPINVGLIGSRSEIIAAFVAAGWDPADAITLRSSIGIILSVILGRPDDDAPVSTLLFEGRHQDLAFEKPVGVSADERHHVRFWRTNRAGAESPPLWLGAASFDRGVGLSHDTGQVTHHIGPDVDADRDLVIEDLEAAGYIGSTYSIPGVGATKDGRNGGGDLYFTDGMATIAVLRMEQ